MQLNSIFFSAQMIFNHAYSITRTEAGIFLLGHSISNHPGELLDRRQFLYKNCIRLAFMRKDHLPSEFYFFSTVHSLGGVKLPFHARYTLHANASSEGMVRYFFKLSGEMFETVSLRYLACAI